MKKISFELEFVKKKLLWVEFNIQNSPIASDLKTVENQILTEYPATERSVSQDSTFAGETIRQIEI